jgi:hypothetical protein
MGRSSVIDEVDRIGEYLYARRNPGTQRSGLIVSSQKLFLPGPIGVIGEVVIGFRMRH